MKKLLPSLIFLTLSLLPTYLIRCKDFGFCFSPVPFTLLEVLILLTFAVWFLLNLKEQGSVKKILEKITTIIPKSFLILTAFFLAVTFFEALVSHDRLGGLGIFKAYFLEPVLLFIVVTQYLSEKKKPLFVISALLFSGLVVASAALIEKIFAFNPLNPGEFFYRGRVSAFFTTSNAVGLLLEPLVFLSLASIFMSKKWWEKGFFSFSFILLSSGIWASGSRGGYVALGVALLIFFGLIIATKIKKEFLRQFSYLGPVLIGLFVVFNCLFLVNISYFLQINFEHGFIPALNQRLCLWEGSVHLVEHNPLVGAGLNGYHVLDSTYSTCSTEQLQYPHNLILNFWIETGFLGLFTFFGIFTYAVYLVTKSKVVNFFTLGFLAAMTVILIHGVVDVPYFKNDLSVVFWVLLALGVYFMSQEKADQLPL